jgi:hypothetical protein
LVQQVRLGKPVLLDQSIARACQRKDFWEIPKKCVSVPHFAAAW